MFNDSQLQNDVLAELKWEPSVTAAHIGVTARNGVVTPRQVRGGRDGMECAWNNLRGERSGHQLGLRLPPAPNGAGGTPPQAGRHNRKQTGCDVWKTGKNENETVRHIRVAPLGDGWAMAEATLDNAQFFKSGSHAEAATRSLGEHLTDAGEPSEISIYLRDGPPGGRFICIQAQDPEASDQ